MLIIEVIKTILRRPVGGLPPELPSTGTSKSVLNVGGGNKMIDIPVHFQNWQHLLLDIDPASGADIIMDARELQKLPAGKFDAVYCSHNLEHYFKHDVAPVLSGFFHVLKSDGFAEIHVPNMRGVLKHFVNTGMELEDTLYECSSGPISVLDVIYGWGKQIETTGVDFYAHKTGFTDKSLIAALNAAGFEHVWTAESPDSFGIGALAFKLAPTATQISLLGLSTPSLLHSTGIR